MLRIRTSRGLSQQEVAAAAGISRQAYRSIETGQAEPRIGNLQRVAAALGVALQELLTEPPRLSSVRFRSGKLRTDKSRLARDQVIVGVARWLKNFNAIEDVLEQKQAYALQSLTDGLKGARGAKRCAEAAAAAREALGLRPDEPIRDICGLLESAGVKVWALKLDLEDFFGLSVAAGEGGPAVVVNVRDDIPVERRIFTVAHELGHLLLHPGAYDIEKLDEDDREEEEANIFATHFLMPGAVFQREWSSTYGLPFVDRVLHVKRIFRVSYQTVLRRLIDLNKADSQIWMIFKAQWKRRSNQSLGKKNEPVPLAPEDFIQDRLSRLVREGLEGEKITLSRGAEVLGKDLREMRDMVASWQVAA
jgi:Zn-dependent peptidase ImmA (M78 family)/transcriptional regulator with XRE-family HTH domain